MCAWPDQERLVTLFEQPGGQLFANALWIGQDQPLSAASVQGSCRQGSGLPLYIVEPLCRRNFGVGCGGVEQRTVPGHQFLARQFILLLRSKQGIAQKTLPHEFLLIVVGNCRRVNMFIHRCISL